MKTLANDAPTKIFELKGGMFPLTVLYLLNDDIDELSRRLGETIRRAPGFFQGAPVVIDLKAMQDRAYTGLASLVALLRQHGLVPVGVRHGSRDQRQAALKAGLGLVPSASAVRPQPTAKEPASSEAVADTRPVKVPLAPKIVTRPVRSGQQIYAQSSDLIVLAAVNAGAEILADGSIHVYGPLRGRALAGVGGQTAARIFCQSLEAEVIAIAGNYRVLEDPNPLYVDRQVQVYLADGRLMIAPI